MKVYISLIADILHAGHIRLINEGSKHGEVIIGLLSEAACSELEQIPFIDYKKRKEVLINITGVSKVIKQNTASYMDNLRKIKPEIVIHGDDWRKNYQKKYRDEVIKFLKTYNGRLIELPYSSDVEYKLKEQSLQNNVSSYSRIQLLSYLIKNKRL